MHERCLVAEQMLKELEEENADLRERLGAANVAGGTDAREKDAYLEKLKTEVKD